MKGGLNFDAAPDVLHADDLADLLRCGRDNAYRLMRSQDFPSIEISETRRIVGKNAVAIWLETPALKLAITNTLVSAILAELLPEMRWMLLDAIEIGEDRRQPEIDTIRAAMKAQGIRTRQTSLS